MCGKIKRLTAKFAKDAAKDAKETQHRHMQIRKYSRAGSDHPEQRADQIYGFQNCEGNQQGFAHS
jgi:hypothetical protein